MGVDGDSDDGGGVAAAFGIGAELHEEAPAKGRTNSRKPLLCSAHALLGQIPDLGEGFRV